MFNICSWRLVSEFHLLDTIPETMVVRPSEYVVQNKTATIEKEKYETSISFLQ